MFHVEQKQKSNIQLDQFSSLIYGYNLKKNITGFKNKEEILNNLVLSSILDLTLYNVPRGTLIADLGSGNGVPGIVLAVLNNEHRFMLIDSNEKKCRFMKESIQFLGLDNVQVINDRAENVSQKYRDKCGVVVSRAFGPVLYSIEFGLSLLQKKGHLFVYSHRTFQNLSHEMRLFVNELGGVEDTVHTNEGIAVYKADETPDIYPRKFPIIKRSAKRIQEFKD